MPESSFAVTLLSLATTYEKACAIEGDLREEAHTRGRAWFVWQVLRTTASLLRASPVRDTAMIVLLGYAVYELALKLNWWVIGPVRRFAASDMAFGSAQVQAITFMVWALFACGVGPALARMLPRSGFKVAVLAASMLILRLLLRDTQTMAGMLLLFGVLPLLWTCWRTHQRSLPQQAA